MRPSKRRKASSGSIWSPTAPTSRTSAKSARQASRIYRPWTSSAAATCSRTCPPFLGRSILCLARWTDERSPPCSTGEAAEGFLFRQGESCLGEEGNHQISGRPSAIGNHSAALARTGTAWRLVAGGSDPPCQRLPRHGAHPRFGSCDVLHDVQSVAGWKISRTALRHDAVPAAWRG